MCNTHVKSCECHGLKLESQHWRDRNKSILGLAGQAVQTTDELWSVREPVSNSKMEKQSMKTSNIGLCTHSYTCTCLSSFLVQLCSGEGERQNRKKITTTHRSLTINYSKCQNHASYLFSRFLEVLTCFIMSLWNWCNFKPISAPHCHPGNAVTLAVPLKGG